MPKILLVEDDQSVAKTIIEWLLIDKYLVEHEPSGDSGYDMLRAYQYDLVILDINLPRMSGIEICREYRNKGGTTPILMLTGRDTIDEKETGLDAGADDYLTKPFHLKELSARVRALLRRPAGLHSEILTCGSLSLDARNHTVTRGGAILHLPRMEFALLEFFMRHPDQVFNPTVLLDRVWTADSDKSPETIRTTIKKLRQKIDEPGCDSILKNVHGVGYKLEPPSGS